MFKKLKLALFARKVFNLGERIYKEWKEEKPMQTGKFYNGWTGTTLIFALISATAVFIGHMLGWTPEQIEGLSKTLVELCAVVGLGGIGGKVAGAIAAKKNGVAE